MQFGKNITVNNAQGILNKSRKKCNPDPKPENYSLESPDNKKNKNTVFQEKIAHF